MKAGAVEFLTKPFRSRRLFSQARSAYQAPRSWTEKAYHNLIYFHEVDMGGHFAAWEQPQLFSEEVRAASGRCAKH